MCAQHQPLSDGVAAPVATTAPPEKGAARRLLDAALSAPRLFGRGLIAVYRYTLSPLIGFHCRHLPTCSSYGDEAIGRFGLWAGGWMTLARLLRCHPFGTSGLDFVPAALPDKARWYMPWRYGRWRGTNAGPDPDPTELDAARSG